MFRAAHSLFGCNVALEHANITPQQKEVAPREFPMEKTFPLLKLPPELRAMVYKPLLKAGDLSVLVVSKLVSQEAVPLLSKVSCLRINIGRPDISPVTLDLTASITLSGILTLNAPDYIQHVDFHLTKATRGGPPLYPKLLYCFGGNMVTRKSCVITIVLGTYESVPDWLKMDDTYRAIAALTGFKSLLLMLEHVRHANHEAFLRTMYRHAPVNNLMHQILLKDYEKIFALLQPTLGPADFQKKVDRHFLSFWPSQYKVED